MGGLVEYANRVAASFTSTERKKRIVKQVKRPVGRPRKRPLELSGAG